jgi:subtilisin family serine protease
MNLKTNFPIRLVTFLFALMYSSMSWSQNYWVFFKIDQNESLECLANDYTAKSKTNLVGTSNWFHAACVISVDGSPPIFDGVERIQPLGRYKKNTLQMAGEDYTRVGESDVQLQMLGLDSFHKAGYRGKGITIALFDNGFFSADSMAAFDSAWSQNRVLAYYDFVDQDSGIFDEDGHGRSVWSIAGAYWPDSLIGAAPEANFLLARTENVHSETHLEEYNWIKAMEWADSIGVDIIHSSLGYSIFDTLEGDYTYSDMDGGSTIITRAAEMAYSKGIFVTNSAGNEGARPWHYITAPCDGEHVLCVGAVDSNELIADFSSRGPSFDGRIKPDVCAMGKGTTFVTNEQTLRQGGGTSFSGPLIAGMVACIKQKWPNMSNERIFEAVIRSSDRYNTPDTVYGYGIPNVLRADSILNVMLHTQGPLEELAVVYPNPNDGAFQVATPNTLVRVALYNMSGVEQPISIEDDLDGIVYISSELDKGIYVLAIEMEGNKVQYRKVVITP